MESYNVQTILSAQDELTPVLESVGRMAAGLDKSLKNLSSIKLFSGMSAEVQAIAGNFDRATRSVTSLATAYGQLADGAAKMKPVIEATQQLTLATEQAAKAQQSLHEAQSSAPPPLAPAEAKRPLVDAGQMQAAGGIFSQAGSEIFGALHATLNAAVDHSHQLDALRAEGVSPADIAAADKQAENNGVATASTSDSLKASAVLFSAFHSISDANKFTPDILKLQETIHSLTGQSTDDLADKTMTGVSAFKDAANDPVTHQPDADWPRGYMDLIQRSTAITQGSVNAGSFATFAQEAGPSVAHFDRNALQEMVQVISMSGGAANAAKGMNSMMTQVTSGTLTDSMAEAWKSLHLLTDDQLTKTKTGYQVTQGDITNGEQFRRDPVAWVESTLLPALAKNNITDPKEQEAFVTRLIGQQAGGQMLAQILQNLPDIHATQKQLNDSPGVTASYDTLVKTDPGVAMKAFQVQLEEFEAVLGQELLPVVTPALHSLAEALKSVTAWARDNPVIVKWIMAFAVGLGIFATVAGGVLVFVGTIAALVAALSGGVVLAIVGVIAAISALVTALLFLGPQGLWDAITGFFKSLWTAITGWWNGLSPKMKLLVGGLGAVFAPLVAPVLGLIYVLSHWHEVVTWVIEGISGFGDRLVALWAGLQSWWDGLSGGMQAMFAGIGIVLAPLLAPIAAVIYALTHWDQVTTWAGERLEAFGRWMSTIWTAVTARLGQVAGEIWDRLKGIPALLGTLWARAVAWFRQGLAHFAGIARLIPGMVSAVWNRLSAAILTGVQSLWNALTRLPKLLLTAAVDLGKAVISFGESLWTSFRNALTSVIDQLGAFVAQIPDLLDSLNPFSDSAKATPAPAKPASLAIPVEMPGLGQLAAGAAPNGVTGLDKAVDRGLDSPVGGIAEAVNGLSLAETKTQQLLAQLVVAIQGAQKEVKIELDGRTLASVVMSVLARATGGPNTGPSSHDPSRSYFPSGTALIGQT